MIFDENYPYERFASFRRYRNFDFLSEPLWLIYVTDINGQFNLWKQKSNLTYGGDKLEPHQLTNFTGNTIRMAYASPTDNKIAFFADEHGSENYQIYIMEAFSGWPCRITNDSGIRHEYGGECFSHDASWIVYSSNKSKSSHMLVYVTNLSNEETTCLTESYDGWYQPGFWSPDSTMINCSEVRTPSNYALWVLDVPDRKMTLIHNSGDKYTLGPWSINSSGFYIISNFGKEYRGLVFYDLYSSRMEWIYTDKWDVEYMTMTKDGSTLAWSVNRNGYSQIYLLDIKSNERKKLTACDGVVKQLKFSPDNKKIGILMTTPTSPPNLSILDIESQNVEKLTNSFLGNISENDVMISPKVVKYKSFDNLEIRSLLYKPRHLSSLKKQVAVVLSIHGGPNNQERPEYAFGVYQYLANKGIAIFAPNYRGSTGYGRSFERKIYHDWGGAELMDLKHGLMWLLSQEWVDPDRIAVMGASFGGFATLSCIAKFPQYNWRAAVDIFGLTNLITTVKSAPAHWRNFLNEFIGDPDKEEQFLRTRSPINHIQDIRTNLLVIQGAFDPQVVRKESDELVTKLKELGSVNLKYMVFEDEGHGFNKHNNSLKACKAAVDFLVNNLL